MAMIVRFPGGPPPSAGRGARSSNRFVLAVSRRGTVKLCDTRGDHGCLASQKRAFGGVDRAKIPRRHIERRTVEELRAVNEGALPRTQLEGGHLQTAIPRRLATAAERNAYIKLCPLPQPELVESNLEDCVVRSTAARTVTGATALTRRDAWFAGNLRFEGIQAKVQDFNTCDTAVIAAGDDLPVASTSSTTAALEIKSVDRKTTDEIENERNREQEHHLPPMRYAAECREEKESTDVRRPTAAEILYFQSGGDPEALLETDEDRSTSPNITTTSTSGLENGNQSAEILSTPSTSPVLREKDSLFDLGNSWRTWLYPTQPHNFTSLRSVTEPGITPLDRAARDVPWESRFELVTRRVRPKYAAEVRGTPRREFQEGMVEGVRVRPVFNPFVELTNAKRYRLDNWPSRNWDNWDPNENVRVRGGRRTYTLPKDIGPSKDELGEWHPCPISGRYKGDIQKQYAYFSLPWVWARDFFNPPKHIHDREPKGRKYWRFREFRKIKVAEALRKMPQLIEEYRREKREAKRLSWFEDMMVKFCGKASAHTFIRKRKRPMH
ncbi:unnamed protein product [Amoebophrya sp. A120]|nr:unnamed protein product [Amoebophrya sp. A120]|eukprot:GSA120T00012651001.1